MPVTSALLILALGCASCGHAASSPKGSPLAVSAPRQLCPASDLKPGVLDKEGTPVLVPDHPSALLICRYGSLEQLGLPGALVGALSVLSPAAIDRLATEFDALEPLGSGTKLPQLRWPLRVVRLSLSERSHRASPAQYGRLHTSYERATRARRARSTPCWRCRPLAGPKPALS